MSLKLGRVGLDIPLREPANWTQSGSEVAINGLLTDTSWWELRAQREQLLGLGHADEPVVVVHSDTVPELDGFYRVEKVDVAAPPGSFGYRALPWQAQLYRIRNWQQPIIEDYFLAWSVPHGWPVTLLPQLTAYHFMPRTAISHADGGVISMFNSYGGATPPTRPSADGDMTYVQSEMTAIGTTAVDTSALWTVPLVDYYRGDCRVEFDHLNDTTGWRRVLGRQVLNKPLQIRLTNGVVRLGIGTSTLVPEWWNGSAWVSSKSWRFLVGGGSSSTVAGWAQVAVLRNTPEEVAIRLIADPTSSLFAMLCCDITIKRGSRWVFTRTFTMAGGNHTWTMEGSSNEAAQLPAGGFTGVGIHKTTNDANGNRWILTSDFATTVDGTNGKLTSASRQQVLYGFGLELGGTGATGTDTAVEQMEEWRTGTQVVMRPVGM